MTTNEIRHFYTEFIRKKHTSHEEMSLTIEEILLQVKNLPQNGGELHIIIPVKETSYVQIE